MLFILLAVTTAWHNKLSESPPPVYFRFPVLYLPPALSRGNPQVWCVDKQDQPDVAEGPVEQISLELTTALRQMHVGSGFQSCRTLSLTSVLKSWACKAIFLFLRQPSSWRKGAGCFPSFTWVPSRILAFITLANSLTIWRNANNLFAFNIMSLENLILTFWPSLHKLSVIPEPLSRHWKLPPTDASQWTGIMKE